MPTPGKIAKVAAAHKIDPLEMVLTLVNDPNNSLVDVAWNIFKVYPNAIRRFLEVRHYHYSKEQKKWIKD